jgi:hypothetical protein
MPFALSATISQNTRMSFAKNFQSIPSEFLQLFLGHHPRRIEEKRVIEDYVLKKDQIDGTAEGAVTIL